MDTKQYIIKCLTRLSQDNQTLSDPARLAKVLRHIADRVEQSNPPPIAPGAFTQPLPAALDSPETGWPWLLENKPWIFDGLPLHQEPYYHYLKKARPEMDAQAISHLDSPSQADVAEILFGDRTKTGGSYRRRILAALEATTTNDQPDNQEKQRKAA